MTARLCAGAIYASVLVGLSAPALRAYEDAPNIGFCGTLVREGGSCGNLPQSHGLEAEVVHVAGHPDQGLYRTPYGVYENYGRLRAITDDPPMKKTLWFEDAEGTIRNAFADTNPAEPHVYIRRKGHFVSTE